MSRKVADLLIVGLLAALALLGGEGGALRALLGLLLVLVLPGYALTAALFPDRALPRTDRMLFTVGFSLGVTILGGFGLNWTPWGLQRVSWTILLSYITLGGCLVALIRRPALPLSARRTTFGLSVGQGLLFVLAALAIIGALVIARSEAAQHPAPNVVQLWILPAEQTQGVRLGVITKGPQAGRYRLVVQRGGYIIREWPDLALAANERWEATVDLPQRQPGAGPVEARLYRATEPSAVYRRVMLWVDQR
ncbi:MAG TPA: DUF1616 domain-containing protein [Herpetosiphonaceae bacterium]